MQGCSRSLPAASRHSLTVVWCRGNLFQVTFPRLTNLRSPQTGRRRRFRHLSRAVPLISAAVAGARAAVEEIPNCAPSITGRAMIIGRRQTAVRCAIILH